MFLQCEGFALTLTFACSFYGAGAKFKRYKAKCAASKRTCGEDDTDCIPALTSLKAMDTVRIYHGSTNYSAFQLVLLVAKYVH